MILAHNNYSRSHPFLTQNTSSSTYGDDSNSSSNNIHVSNFGSSSLAALPQSTYNLAQSTGFDASSRKQNPVNGYRFPSSSPFDASTNSQSLSQVPDLMPSSESWLAQQYQQTPRAAQRANHNRESSLSSLNSNGPASPYNANSSTPQIALNDSTEYHDLAGDSNYSYQLGKPMVSDNFYTSIHGLGNQNNGLADMSFADGMSNMPGPQQSQKRYGDRGLLPAADVSSIGSNTRSHPASVASSTVGGDSQPATPSFQEPLEDESRRRKNAVFNSIPKLDRTMTDVYSDELYSPHFTITSASPQPQTQTAMSPNSGVFAERLALANNQHLSAVQSPVSSSSRTDSPFRQGSPLAPSSNDFAPQIRLNSAQQMREKQKQERDLRALEEQLSRQANQQQGTPSTISPKDALLDFNESDDSSNFPLFPSHEADSFDLNQLTKAVPQQQQRIQQRTPLQTAFDFSMPSNVQMPQQYPFISRTQQQQQPQHHQQQQQQSTPSVTSFSRMTSAETDGSSGAGAMMQRPARTNADGGTYTCTYHGCTLRFETPQLLQKHKREGHRQANALTPSRPAAPAAGVPDTLLGSQAGPHRCDRINPSTGKPCNTVFSRPYDLTRHEDTIHNARKKKVHCNLCTEEKTFSRADALTRHYRVCHPDVEFPGKHRRRGGSAS